MAPTPCLVLKMVGCAEFQAHWIGHWLGAQLCHGVLRLAALAVADCTQATLADDTAVNIRESGRLWGT